MACNGIADDSKSKTTDPQGASQTEQWSTTAEQGSTMMGHSDSVPNAHAGRCDHVSSVLTTGQSDHRIPSLVQGRRMVGDLATDACRMGLAEGATAADQAWIARTEHYNHEHRIVSASQSNHTSEQRVVNQEAYMRHVLLALGERLPLVDRNARVAAPTAHQDRDGMLDDLDELEDSLNSQQN